MFHEDVSVDVVRHFCHIATNRLGVGISASHEALHRNSPYACDFFSVEVLGLVGTARYMVLFVMEIDPEKYRSAIVPQK